MTAEEEFDFRARLQTQLGFGGIRIFQMNVLTMMLMVSLQVLTKLHQP